MKVSNRYHITCDVGLLDTAKTQEKALALAGEWADKLNRPVRIHDTKPGKLNFRQWLVSPSIKGEI